MERTPTNTSRPVAFLYERIAVTDATSLDFDSDPTGKRLGDLTFNQLERPAGAGNLGSAHSWHKQILHSGRSRKTQALETLLVRGLLLYWVQVNVPQKTQRRPKQNRPQLRQPRLRTMAPDSVSR